jgi:hypothetical protein
MSLRAFDAAQLPTTPTQLMLLHAMRRLPRTLQLSIGSEGSFLSIGSKGSVLSIGSIGSACSIGSIGSFFSAFSVLSVGSLLSVLSSLSRYSTMSHRSQSQHLGGQCLGLLRDKQRFSTDQARG